MIGFRPTSRFAQPTAPNPFAGYVAIAPDGTVTIYSAHMDMGQGIYHGTATLVNEELMADSSRFALKADRAIRSITATLRGAVRFRALAVRAVYFRRLIAIAWPAPRRA